MTMESVGAAPAQEAAPLHVVDHPLTTPSQAIGKEQFSPEVAAYLADRAVPQDLAWREGIRSGKAKPHGVELPPRYQRPLPPGICWPEVDYLAVWYEAHSTMDQHVRIRLMQKSAEFEVMPGSGWIVETVEYSSTWMGMADKTPLACVALRAHRRGWLRTRWHGSREGSCRSAPPWSPGWSQTA